MNLKALSHSLVFKIGLSLLLMETLILAVLGWYYIHRFNDRVDADIRTRAEIPGQLMERRALNFDAVRDPSALGRLLGERVVKAEVVRFDGEIFFSSNPEREGTTVNPVLEYSVNPGEKETTFTKYTARGNRRLAVTSQLMDQDKPLGFLYLVVDMSRAAMEKREMFMVYTISSLICILLTSLTELWLVHRLIVPGIKASSDVLHQVEVGDLAARIDVGNSRDELSGLQRDINDMIAEVQRRTEDMIRTKSELHSSLDEKGVMLKEIHHRVKNNMQIISSLIALQAGYLHDRRDYDLYMENKHRINSMAMVHEELYRSEDLAHVGMKEYAHKMAMRLIGEFAGRKITVETNLNGVSLSINTAIPCGLILNELLSNAARHAFVGRLKGNVEISGHKQGDDVTLTVRDNGVGFPKGLDFRNTETLGMQIAVNLTSQLHGELDLAVEDGTAWTLRFSDVAD